jgi:hypothetical protein
MAEIILVWMDSEYLKSHLIRFAIVRTVGAKAMSGACAEPSAFDLIKEAQLKNWF